MQAAAEGALKQLRQIDPAPDEVKVSVGVAVNGKLGVLLVTAGADAHLKVEVVLKAEKAAVFSSTRLGPTSSASLGPTLVGLQGSLDGGKTCSRLQCSRVPSGRGGAQTR
jgi:hypothetical protein